MSDTKVAVRRLGDFPCTLAEFKEKQKCTKAKAKAKATPKKTKPVVEETVEETVDTEVVINEEPETEVK